jgi:hypothetical protein
MSRCGVVLFAASAARSRADGMEKVVPSRPIHRVTRVASSPGLTVLSQLRSGGNASATKAAMPRQPSANSLLLRGS